MKKIMLYVLVFAMTISVSAGCGKSKEADVKETDAAKPTETIVQEQQAEKETQILPDEETAEAEEQVITEEQALDAIKSYCYIGNPDLESIVSAGQYPVYWDISSSDENEIVVLFRSYTGAQNRYYIDRNTGDTYVTEFVPGITSEEARTDESFNVRDYF